MPSVIQVSGIRKTYGRTVAVDEVSFQVNEGEIFGLIGPNGAGKTTTMECVEGVRKLRTEAGPQAVLVAVGGVTLERAPAVLEAGATVIAVVAAIFRSADPAAEFRRWQRALH